MATYSQAARVGRRKGGGRGCGAEGQLGLRLRIAHLIKWPQSNAMPAVAVAKETLAGWHTQQMKQYPATP